MSYTLLLLLLALYINIINSGVCPFLSQGTPPTNNATIPLNQDYINALQTLNIKSVFNDIYNLLTDSQTCWPADTINDITNYGGLFIRLTWHCSGTFRDTDNKGGCAGGRMRFEPEASWDDNTNLDKARALLVPIKEKYGDALSWGDLMVFAGTAAIKYMGGPVSSVCAGRIDDMDGTKSIPLNNITQCPDQGNCSRPLGADTVGLIYVNPEGIKGDPVPSKSAPRIREVFNRMGMNDEETVALIGGGHAFGKAHGACPLGPGEPPKINPSNPWNGQCGTGKGTDTFTSGFEGQWTTNPFQWDNEYFIQLINDNYTLTQSPANKNQWINNNNGYMMLTADLALIKDQNYLNIVTSFSNDINLLNTAFANVWKKLTESGGGFVDNQYKKCINGDELTPVMMTTTSDNSNGMTTTPNVSNANNNYVYYYCILISFIVYIIYV